ncbi:MAG: VWA domain-containing protein, partial [Firmicutes bacterium]|nr:VWA domain-containing protein [Bacillota bacterium]
MGHFTDDTKGQLFSLDGSNTIDIESLLGGLGSFYLAGIDRDDNFYILTEELEPNMTEIRVYTSVRKYDWQGRLTGLCRLPSVAAWPGDAIDVKENGDVFVLLPESEKTGVYKLNFSTVEDLTKITAGPVRASENVVTPQTSTVLASPSSSLTTLTRAEVRNRALQMVNYVWTWQRRYLKTNTGKTYTQVNASIPPQFVPYANDPSIDNVRCVGIPYCWGGWDSLWTHSNGAPWTDWPSALSYYSIPGTPQYSDWGPLVGNVKCTDNYKAGTAGIDCSGFVSAASALAFSSKPNVKMIYDHLYHVNCVIGIKPQEKEGDTGFIYYSGIQPMDAMCWLGHHVLFYNRRSLDGNGFDTLESTTSPRGGMAGAKKYHRSWSSLNNYLIASCWAKQEGDDFDRPYLVENTKTIISGQSVYYKITNNQTQSKTYTITVKAESGNPDLYLYNDQYQLLQSSKKDGSDSLTYTFAPQKSYYVKVYCASEMDATYRITWHNNLDLIFVIDTTGSMWDDIAGVKAAAIQIVNALENETPGYRVAIADYRDFPVSPYGASGDYPYHPVLPFSQDKARIISGIQSLSLGNGLDWPESVYSALIRAINTEGLGEWRDGATKVVIPIG